MKPKLNIEKGSERWFGVTILILSIILVLSSLGRADLTMWLAVIFSALLGLVLYIEGGVTAWIRSSGWKRWSIGDLIVAVSFIFGTFLILNALFLFQAIKNVAPTWLSGLVSTNAIIGGIISGILAIVLIFTPKPKA